MKPLSSSAANAMLQTASAPSSDVQRYWCICFPRRAHDASRALFQATLLRERPERLALLEQPGHGDPVADARGALQRRCADDSVDHARLRAVPCDALPADVERDDLDELQHRARLGERH